MLGYLAAGALIGPYALSIIQHVHGTKALAEFGVVFLMFNIGLEVLCQTVQCSTAVLHNTHSSAQNRTGQHSTAVAKFIVLFCIRLPFLFLLSCPLSPAAVPRKSAVVYYIDYSMYLYYIDYSTILYMTFRSCSCSPVLCLVQLSLERLQSMRKYVFGLGSAQVSTTSV